MIERLISVKITQTGGRQAAIWSLDLTQRRIELKRPGLLGWALATTQQGGRIETWVHDDTGLVAVSTTIEDGGPGGSGYRLTLSIPGGGRCSAALAFLALADFGLLDASEDEVPDRSSRVFRLPVTR